MNALFARATAGKPSPVPLGRCFGHEPCEALTGVSAVLIDPENVVYDATLWRRWLHQVLMRMGVRAKFPEFFSPWDRRFRKDVDLGRRDYWEAFREFLAHAGLSEAQIAELLSAAVCRKRRFESDLRRLPGVQETLVRLAASGVQVYVLTNAPRRFEEFRSELTKMGLGGAFSAGLTSRDLGRAMPSSQSYQKALEHFYLEASRTLFVASQLRLLKGAARCGIRPVACNEDAGSADIISLERFSDLTRLVPPARAKLAG
jgi:FMN phosphatase YigB (HAD superfamily)